MTHPSEQAFPGQVHLRGDGLTKREYFAALAMQGLISSETETFRFAQQDRRKLLAEEAIKTADALIKELSNPWEKGIKSEG